MSWSLGAIAAIGETPQSADRDIYQTIGRQLIVLDCHDVHCYRLLPAPFIEPLPGPSMLKWKIYAVLANAAAAIALGRLCLVLGLSARAAVFATWIAALGFGPMQSVLDPYTSDPVMYLLAPLMMADLLAGRIARAGLMGSLGVLAKEFAAAPFWIFTLLSGASTPLGHRDARRSGGHDGDARVVHAADDADDALQLQLRGQSIGQSAARGRLLQSVDDGSGLARAASRRCS